jgi:hypothetical protein
MNSNIVLKQNNNVKESASLVGMGLILQEKEDYINSKALIQQGIDKIKLALVKDNIDNKGLLLEYVNIIANNIVRSIR